MISGPSKGLSTRVVNFIPQYSVPGQSYHEYIVETFDAEIPINVAELVGNQFIVNGRAFNGAGSGIVSATGELFGLYTMPERKGGPDRNTPPYQQRPRALLPNYAGSLFTVTGQTLQVRDPWEVEGQANRHTFRNHYVSGADESYDAPDHQNMFLASIPAKIMDTEVARSRIIPSFHRPALVNYWNAQNAAWFANVFGSSPQSLLARHQVRPFIFRPMPWDHPNFSGSNRYFDRYAPGATAATMLDALRGLAPDGSGLSPWDIDNDGDTIADSAWIDLGLPNQTTLDGRDYKPLFAILCIDLDGRLNINAHGSLAQLAQDLPPNSEGQFAGTVGSQNVFLPRGLGYGPADIDLSRFFDLPAPQSRAIAESLLRGRYGSDGLPGIGGVNDPLSAIKNGDWPYHHGSPQDSSGTRYVALDHAGTPIIRDNNLETTETERTIDDPYEMRMYASGDSPSSIDQPFTWVELERLLRYSDADLEQLPSRLLNLALGSLNDSASFSNRRNRNAFTTASRDIPVPNDLYPIRHRIWSVIQRQSSSEDSGYSSDRRKHETERNLVYSRNLALYLPPEVLRGQKMDLNRLWSNGRQDEMGSAEQSFGIVREVIDNPGESQLAGGEQAWPLEAPNLFNNAFVRINYLGQGSVPEPVKSPRHARQIYARHLYCLVMAMLSNDWEGSNSHGPKFRMAEDLTEAQNYELTARRVAQWAINVVDFRDPDAIMSPFEYDVSPFNRTGWDPDIDGDPATDEHQAWLADDGEENPNGGDRKSRDRRLVWGCEYPDLLLTETLAFHDRRVRDTAYIGRAGTKSRKGEEDKPETKDPTLDQVQIPQGSLFLELYCTRGRRENTDGPTFPHELYTYVDQGRPDDRGWKLDLGRMAGQTPVWRVAISESHRHIEGAQNSRVSPWRQRRALKQEDSINFDPTIRSLLPKHLMDDVPEPLEIDRIITFSGHRSVIRMSRGNPDRVYYNRNKTSTLLAPSSYALVGPRIVTHIGSQKDNPATLIEDESLVASSQQIVINTMPVQARDRTVDHIFGGLRSYAEPVPGQIRPLGIVVESVLGPGIGMSITEPLPGQNYYPTPEFSSRVGESPDLYVNIPDSPASPIIPENTDLTRFDVPFDSQEDKGKPLADDGILATGMYEDYKTAYLQRLANPLLPWNPRPLNRLGLPNTDYNPNAQVNPYITVDWMPIDVMVFNGSDFSGANGDKPIGWTDEDGTFDIDDADGQIEENIVLQSRERAGDPHSETEHPNIWTQLSVTPQATVVDDPENHLPIKLSHSLGYLNDTYEGPGRIYNGGHYEGGPHKPFPWLAWNNRPFISHIELMLVPSNAPSRLVGEITTTQHEDFKNVNPYRPFLNRSDIEIDNEKRSLQFQAPFRHLLNFLQTTKLQLKIGELRRRDGWKIGSAADLYQLLEYVEVPSRFVGSEKWYNPLQSGLAGLLPPMNRTSRLRDPGKININTIADMRVWNAVTRPTSDAEAEASWLRMTRSRRGYISREDQLIDPTAVPTPDPKPDPKFPHLHSAFPSQFSDPFRSHASPVGTYVSPTGVSTGTPYDFVTYDGRQTGFLPQAGVEATLLRSDALDPSESNKHRPLLGYRGSDAYNDTERHAQFRYDGIQRLANLVTNHSNVFAVWITVGYFEVEPVDRDHLRPMTDAEIDHVYPDGLWLGQELGADRGDSKRHRAFYIIDRSVPVAFEPGKNHNVDKAIMLRRFIE